jgi:uncharacterized membrane protein YebE (DUF533 family)
MKTKTIVIAGLVIVGAIVAYKLYQKNQKSKVVVNVNAQESEAMAEFAGGGGRKGSSNMQPMQPNGHVQPVYTKRHK